MFVVPLMTLHDATVVIAVITRAAIFVVACTPLTTLAGALSFISALSFIPA